MILSQNLFIISHFQDLKNLIDFFLGFFFMSKKWAWFTDFLCPAREYDTRIPKIILEQKSPVLIYANFVILH